MQDHECSDASLGSSILWPASSDCGSLNKDVTLVCCLDSVVKYYWWNYKTVTSLFTTKYFHNMQIMSEVGTYSLCTRWLRRSWVTCSCQPFRTPVLEGGAAVDIVLRVPMFPEFEPSFISGLREKQEHFTWSTMLHLNKVFNYTWLFKSLN